MTALKVTDVRCLPGDSAFLLDDGETSILIDSGFGFTGFSVADNIRKVLGERKLDYIFLTHSHYDHALGSAYILRRYPEATVVELGAGLSCLRRQMKNESSPWINIDFPKVIACREKYIPTGENERNVAFDITDHRWFEEVPFKEAKGVIFLAAGVLHYLTKEAVKELGLIGAFIGGLKATAGGIAVAMTFSLLFGLIFKGKPENL